MKASEAAIAMQNGAPSAGQAWRFPADPLFRKLTGGIALLVAATLLAILIALIGEGWHALRVFGWRFLVTGTLISSIIAMLIAIPVSFGIALFISELAPRWLRGPVSTAVELLAAVPSII